MKVLVAYDGTLQAKEALKYGVEKVREKGGELVAMHVFNRSLFIDYDAIPDAEHIARKESLRYVREAEQIMRNDGKDITSKMIVEDGNPDEEIINYARAKSVDLLLCPPRYKSIIRNFKKVLEAQGRAATESTVVTGTEKLKTAAISGR